MADNTFNRFGGIVKMGLSYLILPRLSVNAGFDIRLEIPNFKETSQTGFSTITSERVMTSIPLDISLNYAL